MELGLLTAPFETWELTDVATWAANNDYQTLEVACWPRAGGEKRRYAGTSHLAIEDMTEARGKEILDELAGIGVSISALGYYPNNLDPNQSAREAVNEHLVKVIKVAAMMGVPVVNTFFGADPAKGRDDNYAAAVDVFRGIVPVAKDHGVKLGIENCPMIFSMDEWPGGKNVASSPYIYRKMFEDFDDTLGMNLDPSHLVWQMIDIDRVVREFAERIYYVHIKDLEIDREGLYLHGSNSMGIGWQVPRLPGLGEVDWSRFVAALYRWGYDGPLVVEHEDRSFEGSDELITAGFVLAANTMRPLIPR